MKGRVERAIRYIRDSFFAARTYQNIDDLNQQALVWMTGIAADRLCPEDRTKRVRDAFVEEQQKLLPLPQEPFPTDEIVTVEIGKTPYARFDLNDYSVPHTYVRRSLVVAACLDSVRIVDGTTVIATHGRSWDRGQQLEDPAHLEPLVDYKRRARKHRGMDRLSSAAPSASRLLAMAAESGANIGNITSRLLVLLHQVGPTELEAALLEAVDRELPTVGAVRQILDRRLTERGLPPPVSAHLSHNERAARVTVKNHALSTNDHLKRTDDDPKKN